MITRSRGPLRDPSFKEISMSDITTLEQSAYRIRRFALRMGEVQGQGYIGQALGWADVLAVAYCHALNLRPEEPEWEERDRFLLSHGHYAIAHYAALLEAGIIPESELETVRQRRQPPADVRHGDLHPRHGDLRRLARPGPGDRRRHRARAEAEEEPAFVYNSMSDGELDEGSTWEAAMGARTIGSTT
jgi:transketolase